MLDCNIAVREFEIQSLFFVHVRKNNLEKSKKLLPKLLAKQLLVDDHRLPFQQLLHQRLEKGTTLLPGLLHFTLTL